MKKKLIKSGAIATGVSILIGIINLVLSFSGIRNVIGDIGGVEQSIPWVQTLIIMAVVFVIMFVILLVYYFVIKGKVKSINP